MAFPIQLLPGQDPNANAPERMSFPELLAQVAASGLAAGGHPLGPALGIVGDLLGDQRKQRSQSSQQKALAQALGISGDKANALIQAGGLTPQIGQYISEQQQYEQAQKNFADALSKLGQQGGPAAPPAIPRIRRMPEIGPPAPPELSTISDNVYHPGPVKLNDLVQRGPTPPGTLLGQAPPAPQLSPAALAQLYNQGHLAGYTDQALHHILGGGMPGNDQMSTPWKAILAQHPNDPAGALKEYQKLQTDIYGQKQQQRNDASYNIADERKRLEFMYRRPQAAEENAVVDTQSVMTATDRISEIVNRLKAKGINPSWPMRQWKNFAYSELGIDIGPDMGELQDAIGSFQAPMNRLQQNSRAVQMYRIMSPHYIRGTDSLDAVLRKAKSIQDKKGPLQARVNEIRQLYPIYFAMKPEDLEIPPGMEKTVRAKIRELQASGADDQEITTEIAFMIGRRRAGLKAQPRGGAIAGPRPPIDKFDEDGAEEEKTPPDYNPPIGGENDQQNENR